VHVVGPRDDQQPARVLVKAVDDSRPAGIAAASQQVAEQVDERLAAMRGGRVDDQAGGLVDDRQRVVGVDDSGFGLAQRRSSRR
jgi:hypothetical protein